MDFSWLDADTIKDYYMLPYIKEIIDKIVGHKIYSFINYFSRYYQVAMALEDKNIITFFLYNGVHFSLNECHLVQKMYQWYFSTCWNFHLNYIFENSFKYTLIMEPSMSLRTNTFNIYNKSLKLVTNMASTSVQINTCFHSFSGSYLNTLSIIWASYWILKISNEYKICLHLAIKRLYKISLRLLSSIKNS